MIKLLSIRNLLLIDEIDLSLDRGLCVLTGETGAGKSMILDSLNLITGERAKSGLRPENGKILSIYLLSEFSVFVVALSTKTMHPRDLISCRASNSGSKVFSELTTLLLFLRK